MSKHTAADVVVCGAGPVGLFLAYQLTKHGHSVYIFDKKPGPTDQSRAFLITPRTLEILHQYGVAYRPLQESLSTRGAFMNLDGHEIGRAYFTDVDTLFPQLTLLAQSSLETMLVDELAKLHCTVHWDTTLESYEQHDDHVNVTVSVADGTKATATGAFLVGADGSHSRVRKQDPSWTYKGNRIRSKFALADLELDGPSVKDLRDYQCIFYGVDGGAIFLPLPHKGEPERMTVRMVVNFGDYVTDNEDTVNHGVRDDQEDVLTMEDATRLLKERTGNQLDVTVTKAPWLTYFSVNERMANGFRRGRVFLVGDACHCHSPAGGQGMNIGLHDANNLAWKLSLVLNGHASDVEKLLESYSTEREPMVKEVLQLTGATTRMAFNSSKIVAFLRFVALSIAFRMSFFRNMFTSRLMQINYRLGASPILSNSSTSSLIAAGEYIRESDTLTHRLVAEQLTRKTLYQILGELPGRHVAVWVLARAAHQDEPPQALTDAFLQRINDYKSCAPLVIQNSGHYTGFFKSTASSTDAYWIDPHALTSPHSLTSRLGVAAAIGKTSARVPPAALVLIRPDHYIAYSGNVASDTDLDTAFAFFDTYLSSTKS
ncbi:FAD binding domain-containing protein [Gongronella butleri]|nr:FAD binding domain-containing protein [Gongronella butleri]